MKKLLIFIVVYFSLAGFVYADSACSFTRSLTIGSRGDDVKCLQTYLQKDGYFIYSGGATGYFGPITRTAVSKWQAANSVSPTFGFFGPISRAKYKEIISTKTQTKTESSSLSLPAVSDNEIIIDSTGVSTTENYIEKFLIDTSSTSTFSFDARKFNSVIKDENGVFLFIPDLAEKTIQDGVNQKIKDSLSVNKEFINAKLDYFKSMKVFGEAIALHKKMIGFDKLTLQLAQKISDFGDNKISKTDLSNFFDQYKNLAESERKELLKKVGLITQKPSLLKRIISMFGIEDQFLALAAGLPPFGGRIGIPFDCDCSYSYLISVGPPTSPISGSLIVPFTFLASPLFYIWDSLRPTAWWLGLYSPAIVPCFVISCCPCPGGCCPCCIPVGFGNLIYMTGTSL